MTITLTLPDDVGWLLKSRYDDISQHTLEVLVGHAYQEGILSSREVGRILQHTAGDATTRFLSDYPRREPTPDTSAVHLERRRQLLRERIRRNNAFNSA